MRLLAGLVDDVDGAAGAGVVVHPATGDPRLVAAVGVAETWDAAQVGCGCGPVATAARTEQVTVVDPVQPSDHAELAALAPVPHAVVVVPGTWAEDGRLVTTLYLDREVHAEALDTVGRYEPMLAAALGLLEYCGDAELRATHLLRMMQYRHVIEQAKGLLMSRRSTGPDEAFAALAECSQRENVRLRELAAALVEAVGGAPAEDPVGGSRLEVGAEAVGAAKRLWDDLSASGSGPSAVPG